MSLVSRGKWKMAVNEPEAVALSRARVSARRGALTHRGRRSLLITIDMFLVTSSVLGGLAVWAHRAGVAFRYPFVERNWIWVPLMVGTWLVTAAISDLYRPNVAAHFREVAPRVLRAQAILFGLYLIIYFLSKPKSLPRGLVVYYVIIATPLIFGWRWFFSAIFCRSRFRLRTLVLGAGWAGRTIAEIVEQNLQYECDLVGFVDDDLSKHTQKLRGIRVLGAGDSLLDLVRLNGINLLVVAITHGMRPNLFRDVLICQQAGVGVMSMTALYEQALERTPVHHLSEEWFLDFEPPDLLTQTAKRMMDIAFSLLILLGFTMILPFLVLAIYLYRPGPIFYKQQRVGRNGCLFWVYKLRSMVPNAEVHGARWAEKGDPRVTRVGRVLRRTRLDEIPQAWNILKGEMSLIGPRPERPEFVVSLQEHIPYYRSRLSVKPGLTGWAQVRYRYGNSVEDARIKLEYDLYYIKHQSLLLDFLILLRTIGVVLAMGGT